MARIVTVLAFFACWVQSDVLSLAPSVSDHQDLSAVRMPTYNIRELQMHDSESVYVMPNPIATCLRGDQMDQGQQWQWTQLISEAPWCPQGLDDVPRCLRELKRKSTGKNIHECIWQSWMTYNPTMPDECFYLCVAWHLGWSTRGLKALVSVWKRRPWRACSLQSTWRPHLISNGVVPLRHGHWRRRVKISAWLPWGTLLYSYGEGEEECCIGLAHSHYVCLAGRPTSDQSAAYTTSRRGGAYGSYHESMRRSLRVSVRRILGDDEDGEEFSMCLDRGHQVRHLRQRVARRIRSDPNSFEVCAGRRSDPLAEDCILEDGDAMYVRDIVHREAAPMERDMSVMPPPAIARPRHDRLGGATPTVINGASWYTYNIRADAQADGGHRYACLIWMELSNVLPVIFIYDYNQEGMQHMARWLCVCV